MLLAFLFGTNTVMCIFLPMAAARGIKDVTTALRAIRISTSFFVLSCLITLATHDTIGWVTIALVWLGHVTMTGAELYLVGGQLVLRGRADGPTSPRRGLPRGGRVQRHPRSGLGARRSTRSWR